MPPLPSFYPSLFKMTQNLLDRFLWYNPPPSLFPLYTSVEIRPVMSIILSSQNIFGKHVFSSAGLKNCKNHFTNGFIIEIQSWIPYHNTLLLSFLIKNSDLG